MTPHLPPLTARARFPRVASLRTPAALRAHLTAAKIPLAFDDERAPAGASPLASPRDVGRFHIGNRCCILPMEGWDGERDGSPSDLNRRRWRHFGISGAKLIWGGEAVAVRHDGRASPNQLLLTAGTATAIARLREDLVTAHRERYGADADRDLLIGLQLTHSGRFAKPDASDRPDPRSGCIHPILDRRFPHGPHVFDDEELDRLVDDFVAAARRAQDAGFGFVDFKHCHGYLGHELLGARTRPGRYGGGFENRTRFTRNVIAGIQAEAPGLAIGVRLSVFDVGPYRKDADGVGEREAWVGDAPADLPGFGVLSGHDGDGGEKMDAALDDSRAFIAVLEEWGVRMVCVTAGSPYYCPHITRPAFLPPSDGYLPPEDPLMGVARQIRATALLKASFPKLTFVGSGYSYLQEWLPHVAEYNVRNGLTDFVGLGRMVLSYPEMAADMVNGAPLKRGALCRTFSDCTTGPRLGLVSGCFPLDPFYQAMPEAATVLQVRTKMSARAPS